MANKIPLAIADVELQISTAIGVGDTTFSVSSATDDDGNALPAGYYCFTLDNGTSQKEYLVGQLNGTDITSVESINRQGTTSSGAARKHRVGAPCIITNFATIRIVEQILRGQEDLDSANPIGYDAEPTLASRPDLATVGYVLDTVSGGTVAFDAQIITGNAGETVADGDLVYFKTSDQEWYKTDADTAATVESVQLGIAQGAGSDGAGISGGIQISGTYTTTGLTAGSIYYASNTAGEYGTTAGTTKQAIGIAFSATKLLLIPRNPQNTTTRQEDALAGGGDFGTPSASNKFVTETFLDNAVDVQEFTATGTWTKPNKGTYAVVDIIGAGGSGAAAKDATDFCVSSAGSGGAYRQFIIKLSDLDATETVTIGAGGVARTASADNTTTDGASGGVSWFKDSVFQANGGLGGNAGRSASPISVDGVAGGVTASDLISESGAASQTASNNPANGRSGLSKIYAGASGGGAATYTATTSSGTGGSSLFLGSIGGNGAATLGTGGATATAGVRGGGGGGACVTNASGDAVSGAGGNGYVRVTVF